MDTVSGYKRRSLRQPVVGSLYINTGLHAIDFTNIKAQNNCLHLLRTSMASAFNLLLFFLVCSIFCSTWPTASGGVPDHAVVEKFERWMAKYGRAYKNMIEKSYRLGVFAKNLKYVDAFSKSGRRNYTIGLNQFADLTNEEFMATHTGLRRPNAASKPPASPCSYQNVTGVPSSVDWRRRGAVSPVKDQGSCGSCWAFSSVAAIEGITKIKKMKLMDLSEQELVDCVSSNFGCNGGWMNNAFAFVVLTGGITTEAKYPYVGYQRGCDFEKLSHHAASIAGYQDVPAKDEGALMAAVSHQPVSVAIDAGGLDFQLYTGGIFSGPCGTDLNHAVTVVGYGKDGRGIKYWIAKNSWSSNWGDHGYILMKKDVAAKEGLCGIAMAASYPTV
ncbi:unnamed protein product [Musa acuminata var. zebrina]